MIDFVIHTIVLTSLVIGSWTDIKRKEVPDFISYGIIFIGLFTRLIYSFITNDFMVIVSGIVGLGIFFGISLLLFYTGQWGGGDSKMLMGLGALIGFNFVFDWPNIPTILIFFINILIAGSVLGFIYGVVQIAKKRKEFKQEYKEISSLKKHRTIRNIFFIICFILLISMLFVNFLMRLIFLVLIAFIIASYYIWLSIKTVEKISMYKTIPVSRLTEGDWIAKEIKYNGKLLAGPKDLGVTKEQIEQLKKHNIKHVEIKEGIPFIPSFLIAYVALLVFHNWLVYIF